MSITFTLNGAVRALPAKTPPAMTLLDWLRAAGLTGTKEGCAEGDCGACTVVIEALDGARAPVNACLMTLGQAHGLALRSVEGLSAPDGAPHPVQAAMRMRLWRAISAAAPAIGRFWMRWRPCRWRRMPRRYAPRLMSLASARPSIAFSCRAAWMKR